MKKVSFLVAFLAILQIVTGVRLANAQERIGDRRTVEEAIDRAGEDIGEDIGEELEAVFEQLGLSAEKLGHSLEHWAEENSEELEAWSEKYSGEWEAFGERLGRKMERLGSEQESVWSNWAERYEHDLTKWADKLENQSEFSSDSVGELLERNLDMLSQMPLGQLVDEAFKEGVGELRDAPWESLGELTELAQDALKEPLSELSSELSEVLDPDSEQIEAIRRGSGEIVRSLDQLKRDIEKNISDEASPKKSVAIDRVVDSRLRTLEKLLDNENLSREQRERIEQAVNTLQDIELLRKKEDLRNGKRASSDREPQIDVRRRDQIMEKIEREKQRHNDALRAFNDDLQKSSEQSRSEDQRQSNREREMDNRRPKRANGKNLDQSPSQPSSTKKDPLTWFRDGREGRADQRQKGQRTPPKKDSAKRTSDKDSVKESDLSEVELLRRELEALRKEVRRMKEDGS